jgi:hypothetical protein
MTRTVATAAWLAWIASLTRSTSRPIQAASYSGYSTGSGCQPAFTYSGGSR